jgi:bacteriorhodopsin
MVFEFGDTLNKFIDACLQNSTLSAIAHSPIWTAVVCVCVMMLIALLVFDASMGQVVRFGFWATMCMVGLMILHNRVIMYEAETSSRAHAYKEVFVPAPMMEHTTGYVPAKPTLPSEQS